MPASPILSADKPGGGTRGAVSTEFVIVVVLVAVFGILGYMMIGQRIRSHQQHITDKVGGQEATNERQGVVQSTDFDQDRNDIGGGLSSPGAPPVGQIADIP